MFKDINEPPIQISITEYYDYLVKTKSDGYHCFYDTEKGHLFSYRHKYTFEYSYIKCDYEFLVDILIPKGHKLDFYNVEKQLVIDKLLQLIRKEKITKLLNGMGCTK